MAVESPSWRHRASSSVSPSATLRPLQSSAQGLLGKLARPTSPVAVLSHSAVDRLSSPLVHGGSPQLGLGSSASAPALVKCLSASAPQLRRRSRPQLVEDDGGGRKVSKNFRAFNRRVLSDFVDADHERQRRAELTAAVCSSKRAVSPSRHDVGLGVAARRENYKKEQMEARLQRSSEEAVGSPGATATTDQLGVTATAEDLGVLKPEAFLADIAAVEKQFGELERSLRLEHMTEGGQADRQKAEREAERRRKEDAMRRARKKEQEARDPKKKVALRLENKREFEKEKIEKDASIPMTKVDFGGGFKSHEEVALVDVRKLRTKCCFMEEGINVRNMVDTLARRERQDKMMRSTGGRTSTSSMYSSRGMLSTSRSSPGDLWEMRSRAAADMRSAGHVDSLLQKIGTMRNNCPYSLPYKFEVLPTENLPQDDKNVRMRLAAPASFAAIACSQATNNLKDRKVAEVLAAHFSPELFEDQDEDEGPSPLNTTTRPKAPRRTTTRQLSAMVGEANATLVGLATPAEGSRKNVAVKPKKEKPEPVDEVAEEVRRRIHKRWTMARSLVQWLIVYRSVVRRNLSAELVKGVVQQLGEWARMRTALTRLINSVKVLQRTCRAFAVTKRKRCALIEKDWQRVEDHHLQAYFSLSGLAKKTESDPKGEKGGAQAAAKRKSKQKEAYQSNSAKQKEDKKKLMEANTSDASGEVGWRCYRIPVKHRRETISRYYMAMLRKQVRNQGNFLQTVKVAVTAERELISFLRAFGANDDAIKDLKPSIAEDSSTVKQQAFWQVSEETVVQLIAVAAQGLVGVEPFKFHPANLDSPDGTPAARVGRRTQNAMQVLLGEKPIPVGRLAKKAEPGRGRQTASNTSSAQGGEAGGGGKNQENAKGGDEQGAAGAKAKAAKRVDVEQVFDRFTPRLREICEEQSNEYRLTALGGSESGSSGGAGEGGAAVARGAKDDLVLGLANAMQLPSVEN